jgi:natural product precursor
MVTKKLSLDNIQGKLSRSEMKNVMGGKYAPGDDGADSPACNAKKTCTGTLVEVPACAGNGCRAQSTGSGTFDWECCV